MEHIVIDDMLQEILLRVNNIDLCRCRRVNRRWRAQTLNIYKPITWRGEYIEYCRKGNLFAITTGDAVKYKERRFISDAAQSGSWDMIHYFGFPVTSYDSDNVLEHACMGDNIELIRFLITMYWKRITVDAMIEASRNGNMEIVKFLLKGKSLHPQAYETFVEVACKYGHSEVAKQFKQMTVLYGFPLYECCHGGLSRLAKKIKFKPNEHNEEKLWLNIGIGGSRPIISHFSKSLSINYDKLVSGAIKGGHIDLVKEYVHMMSHLVDTNNIVDALESRKMDMLKYLLSLVSPSNLDINRIFSDIVRSLEHMLVELPMYEILFDFLYDHMKESNILTIGCDVAVVDYYPIIIKCLKWCKEHIPHTTTKEYTDRWYRTALEERSYAVLAEAQYVK